MRPGWIIVIAVVSAAGGCQQPVVPEQASTLAMRADGELAFTRLWESCLDVLRAQRFRIDREDLRAGVITTFPETSQQFFEFWRHDVDTAYDFAEASLRTVRRRVTVQLTPAVQPGTYELTVTVDKERMHLPERQVTNAAAALRIFGTGLPSTAGLPVGKEPATWTFESRDYALEQRLCGLIHAQLAS